jgi:hypothetical protein
MAPRFCGVSFDKSFALETLKSDHVTVEVDFSRQLADFPEGGGIALFLLMGFNIFVYDPLRIAELFCIAASQTSIRFTDVIIPYY